MESESTCGIPHTILDEIKIYLQYETAEMDLTACRGALLYWAEKYNKEKLLVCAELLEEFSQQPDPDYLIGPTINVSAWILDHFYSLYEEELFPDGPESEIEEFENAWLSAWSSDPKQMERALKAGLLAMFAPKEFEKLSGRVSPWK